MCGKWRLVGVCALALGIAVLIAAVFPSGLLLCLLALLLIVCAWGLLRR